MTRAWFAVVCLALSCKKDPEPPTVPPPLPPPSTAPAAPAAPPIDSLTPPAALPIAVTWEDPPAFPRVPGNNPMRKATYKVPKAKGDAEDGELAVFYFGPTMGGSIDDNVNRWVKQFSGIKPDDVKRADREANGLKQHTVEIESGTFSSGMPGGPTQPKPGYGLLGGIVSSPSGVYFFKLTGPTKTVKAARDPFLKMLDSVKVSG
jgi:hypothetical protein